MLPRPAPDGDGADPEADDGSEPARIPEFGSGTAVGGAVPEPASTATPAKLPFFPALDGLRGIIIISVVVFHAERGFPGALLSITGFFVLSGFLITSLLLSDFAMTGRIRVGRFLAHRARRLLPAALAAIIFAGVFWSLLDLRSFGSVPADEVVGVFRTELLGAAFYFHNWLGAFGPTWSGFSALVSQAGVEPSPVAHFWSLSVEEQFYLFYPVALYAGLRLVRTRARFAILVTALVALLLFTAPTLGDLTGAEAIRSMDRIYLGSDTRIPEILVGVLLGIAFSYPGIRDRIRTAPWLGLVGSAVLGMLIWGSLTVSMLSPWLYNHGFLLVGLFYAVVVAALTQHDGPLVKVMSWAPLRWLGERSYGLYLYHFPIQRWLDEGTTGIGGWPLFALQTAVILIVGMISYTFMELPIRRGIRPTISYWWAVAGLSGVALVFGASLA